MSAEATAGHDGHGHGHDHHGHDDHPQGHHGHTHDHPHGNHDEAGHAGHGHSHAHRAGLRGALHELFVPHSHDAADAIDDAMEANAAGIRALKIGLAVLFATTVLQAVVVAFSGSVALLADTVHNLSDALTAVPLWIAFVLGRRAPSRRYTYGLGRAEDLAGLFIVFVVALSAVVAAWQSVDRMLHPQPIDNVGWVIAAGVIGFAGNEAVAIHRIRVGRRIGSAALVADGVHARTDGFTSLAVVVGGIGVLLGFPLADPIVGLVIAAAILVLLVGTVRSVGRRLLDGVEPDLVDRAEHALGHVDGVESIERLRMRWIGHRLHGDAVVRSPVAPSARELLAGRAERSVRDHLRNVDDFSVTVRGQAPGAQPRAGAAPQRS